MAVENRFGGDGSLLAQRRNHAATSQPTLRGIKDEPKIRRPPWTAACLAHKIRDFLSRNTATPIRAIGDPDLLNNASSLALFPAALACPGPSIAVITTLLHQALLLLPRSAHGFCHAHLHSHLSTTPWTTTPTATPNSRYPNTASTHPTITPHNRNTTPPHYRYLQTALLTPTPRAALTHLLIAATLSHIRRTLAPQLGGYLWRVHPLDGLRLAVSNPEVFVAEMLGGVMPAMDIFGGPGGVMGARGVKRAIVGAAVVAVGRGMGGLLVKVGLDVAAGWAGDVLVGGYCDGKGVGGMGDSEGRVVGGNREWKKEGAERDTRRMEVWLQVLAVGYLLWVLVTVEYVFARGMNTAAWLVACYRLLVSGKIGRIALVRALESNWAQLPFVTWQLVHYLGKGVGPLLWRSVWCAVRGRPALLLAVVGVVGGVRMLLKYRSTFYIALEVSGVFVFLGYLLIAFALLGSGLLGQLDVIDTTPAKAQRSSIGGVLNEAGLKVKTMANKESFNGMGKPQSRKWSGKQGVYRKRAARQ